MLSIHLTSYGDAIRFSADKLPTAAKSVCVRIHCNDNEYDEVVTLYMSESQVERMMDAFARADEDIITPSNPYHHEKVGVGA